MTQPEQRPAFYQRQPITLVRILYFIAAVCFFIAALTVAKALHIGPDLAWAFGGFTAWMLTGAV